jgi:hypothetical protein
LDNCGISWELYGYASFDIISIDSILAAYNSACVEMRSEARDAYIQYTIETI